MFGSPDYVVVISHKYPLYPLVTNAQYSLPLKKGHKPKICYKSNGHVSGEMFKHEVVSTLKIYKTTLL